MSNDRFLHNILINHIGMRYALYGAVLLQNLLKKHDAILVVGRIAYFGHNIQPI